MHSSKEYFVKLTKIFAPKMIPYGREKAEKFDKNKIKTRKRCRTKLNANLPSQPSGIYPGCIISGTIGLFSLNAYSASWKKQ
jgi:hypothetical protein